MIEIKHTDCMDYMGTCKDKQFDLAIVDPPYFSGPDKLGYYGEAISTTNVKRGGYEKTNDWEVPGQDYFDELLRVSKHQIIWGINYYDIKNPGPGRIIWDKVNGDSSFSDCEIAYCSIHDSVRMVSYMWNGMLQGKSISEGRTQQGNKKKNEKRIHPTQKPIIIYDWLLEKYAKPGMKIIDTHLGSGSICISAHAFGVDLICCEKTKQYAVNAQERYDRFTAQMSF
ncbi:site-specific DNA-methyltransferase [Candidatus Pacearchaeota archaeon]|nr:site-specific DNA-methyltransferase [Candidatus Pacearchaeota archaeon]